MRDARRRRPARSWLPVAIAGDRSRRSTIGIGAGLAVARRRDPDARSDGSARGSVDRQVDAPARIVTRRSVARVHDARERSISGRRHEAGRAATGRSSTTRASAGLSSAHVVGRRHPHLLRSLTDGPKGIYSVPALGGEERLVLENARAPWAMPTARCSSFESMRTASSSFSGSGPRRAVSTPLPAVTELTDSDGAAGERPRGGFLRATDEPRRRLACMCWSSNLVACATAVAVPLLRDQEPKRPACPCRRDLTGRFCSKRRTATRSRSRPRMCDAGVGRPCPQFPGASRDLIWRADGTSLCIASRTARRSRVGGGARRAAGTPSCPSRVVSGAGIAPLPDGRALMHVSAGGRSNACLSLARDASRLAILETDEETDRR